MRFVVFLRLGLLLILAILTVEVRADLSAKQARKLITRMAGVELPISAVRVKRISSTSNSSAEATAEIHTIFRLATNTQGLWRVAELRVGQDRWEELVSVAASQTEMLFSACDGPHLRSGGPATELSTKRARCLIAAALGVQLPSDAVRIKTVSPLELPLASRPSAVVESLITAELRFARDKGGWVVAALRTGNRDWISPEALVAAANETKRKQARAEMDAMVRALVGFQTERQSYVASDSHAVLIDHLSPRFLSRVIRLDPWHEPYRYRGERSNFTLRSLGADRKENTVDDIVVSSPLTIDGQRP
ncbi:MAG: type II secretion system protein GspG [Pyrinomonadaceae bacterium]|nr:type II secretion system protein GspG [Pyrinomonadaceae bacterium]MBA3570878.1 type II secretion system protein GspG [Pyrinomonadaceae bacterium]MDQ3175824.1 type II secretion system protein GspG [Acidobacteriota bacterium]